MTATEDLSKLKELLKLKQCRYISDQKTRDQYNTLIDWASYKYWKLDISKIVTSETSISSYYKTPTKKPFKIEKGNYIFLPMCFGNVFIYFKGSMMELGSGNTIDVDDRMREINDAILLDLDVEFLRFVYFKERWILEDCFSKYRSPVDVLRKVEGLVTVPHIHIKVVDEDRWFLEDDYDVLEGYFLSHMRYFRPECLCFIKEGYSDRYIVDFFSYGYVRVKDIELEQIRANCFFPTIRTTFDRYVMVKDIHHLVKSRARIDSYVTVKKKKRYLILTSTRSDASESSSEVLCRIMNHLGPTFFVNGNYLSRINNNACIQRLSKSLGIQKSCKNIKELTDSVPCSEELRTKLRTQSMFEIVRECLGYPKHDFLTLVNNMKFNIDNNSVSSFMLEDITCLNNPNVSVIYANFNNFVSLFNVLSNVKQSIRDSVCV
ncbi:gp111R [Rabbit fibroma virus]|uniref:Gp111R n=1 Tax=Rabbit fibroma virus (strain Kasza) TaxID=10272 RepID=Q9Q8W7_RFVKA|nr:gp111R [Rabbit fibroma virus]AAF17994.1 gp111R [Rabbit fibroma virus]